MSRAHSANQSAGPSFLHGARNAFWGPGPRRTVAHPKPQSAAAVSGGSPQSAAPMMPQTIRRPPLKNVAVSLVIAPLVVFIGSSTACAVFWHVPVLPTVLTVAALLVALPVSMPHGDLKAHIAAGDVLVPVGMCFFAAVTGVLAGVYAHECFMAPFYAIALGRSYDNVLASTPGAAYADAGKLRFAESSAVNVGMAIGYRQNPRYCVAPVMDSGPGQLRRASFWAIGVDCCEVRGGFTCGAISGAARGGVRAVPDGLFVSSRREYIKAISQAAAIADLAVDDDPILVHWVEKPNAEQFSKFGSAVGVLGIGAGLFTLTALLALAVETLRYYAQNAKAARAEGLMPPI